MPFVGEAQVLILKVITPASGGSTAITVNYVTDQVATLNDTIATLATLSIPYATTAYTYFVLQLTPQLAFKIYSLLQYEPSRRLSPALALKHPYFRSLK